MYVKTSRWYYREIGFKNRYILDFSIIKKCSYIDYADTKFNHLVYSIRNYFPKQHNYVLCCVSFIRRICTTHKQHVQ